MAPQKRKVVKVEFECVLVRRADCAVRGKPPQNSFYQVFSPRALAFPHGDIQLAEMHPPPYIVAPYGMGTGMASNVIAIQARISTLVVQGTAMPLASDYARPKRMAKMTAATIGIKDFALEVPCKSIEKTLKKASAYAKKAGPKHTKKPSRGKSGGSNEDVDQTLDRFFDSMSRCDEEDCESEEEGSGDEEEEDEEEEEGDEEDANHLYYRSRHQPATIFGPHATQCYNLSAVRERSGAPAGTCLPLTPRRAEEMKNPRNSPRWTVDEILGVSLATYNVFVPSMREVPLLSISGLVLSGILAPLGHHKDGIAIAQRIKSHTAGKTPTGILTEDDIPRLCIPLGGSGGFKTKAAKQAASKMVAEATKAIRLCARGNAFVSLLRFFPYQVLDQLSQRQLRALAHCIRTDATRALFPTEMAAVYSSMTYFRPFLLQRLAYGRSASLQSRLERDTEVAIRSLANTAWYGNGSTFVQATVENNGFCIGDDVEFVAKYPDDMLSLASSAFYCSEIRAMLFKDEGQSRHVVVRYCNVGATLHRLGEEMRTAATEREVLRDVARKHVLFVMHSASLLAEARSAIGSGVISYDLLVSMGDLEARRVATAAYKAVVVFRADALGESELYRLLESFDTSRTSVILMHNPDVLRARRFFGSGAPSHAIYLSKKFSCVDWATSTLGVSNLGAGVMRSLVFAEELPPDVDVCEANRGGEELRLRRFIVDHGRAVQFFTVGSTVAAKSSQASDKEGWVGHQKEAPLIREAIRIWNKSYASNVAFEANKSYEVAQGQRIYVEDMGQLAIVEELGYEDPSGGKHMISRPSAQGLPLDARRPEVRLRLASNQANHSHSLVQGYVACCSSKGAGDVIVPAMHHVRDGICVPIEAYAGSSVDAAVVFIGKAVSHRALASVFAVVRGDILLVPLFSKRSTIENIMRKRPATGRLPMTPLTCMLRR